MPAGPPLVFASMTLMFLGILAGSRRLRDYDPALLTYTFGTLFAAFGVAYRYASGCSVLPQRFTGAAVGT